MSSAFSHGTGTHVDAGPAAAWLLHSLVQRHARTVLPGVAVVMAGAWLAGCAVRSVERPNHRMSYCPPGRIDNYLSSEARQCWFYAPQGRWRTLSHELHYDVVVVRVEATSLDDADAIARRFVEVHGRRFSEVMIYVQAESAPMPPRIRRVRWTDNTGFERLEFIGLPGR